MKLKLILGLLLASIGLQTANADLLPFDPSHSKRPDPVGKEKKAPEPDSKAKPKPAEKPKSEDKK